MNTPHKILFIGVALMMNIGLLAPLCRTAMADNISPAKQNEITKIGSGDSAFIDEYFVREGGNIKTFVNMPVLLKGTAYNAKLGAVVEIGDVPFYIENLLAWPEHILERTVEVHGFLLQQEVRIPPNAKIYKTMPYYLLTGDVSWGAVVDDLISPDESLSLKTSVNHYKDNPPLYNGVVVMIFDNEVSGIPLLHTEITPISAQGPWSIQWVGNNKIMMDHADIERVVITRQKDGSWESFSGPLATVDISDKEWAIDMAKAFIRKNNIEVIDIENPVEVTDQGDVWHIIFKAPQEPDALPPFRGFNVHKDTGRVYETPRL